MITATLINALGDFLTKHCLITTTLNDISFFLWIARLNRPVTEIINQTPELISFIQLVLANKKQQDDYFKHQYISHKKNSPQNTKSALVNIHTGYERELPVALISLFNTTCVWNEMANSCTIWSQVQFVKVNFIHI